MRDTFNQMADAYEHSVDSDNLYNAEYERPAMVERMPGNLSGKKVLDAGCAAGWYTYLMMNRTLENFELLQVIEPLPTEVFRERDPERFERLMKEPNFLIIEARKRGFDWEE